MMKQYAAIHAKPARFLRAAVLMVSGWSMAMSCAHAQGAQPALPDGLPDGLIKIVVGFAPGGAADLTARTFAEQLSKEGVKEVIVDNRPGASTRIANSYVQRAAPDGLTLLLATSPAFTIYPHTYKNLGYDGDKDFRPIALLVDIPTAIVTGAGQPYSNMKEYVAWAKAHPANATVGLAAQGSSGQLGTIALGKAIGVDIAPVVYKGASPMLVDVASDRVSMGWDAAASMMPLYQGGKIKFLGLSGSDRLASLPNVPTAKEQGFPQFEAATSFYAVFAPAGLPDKTAAALERVFLKAAQDPALVKRLQENGLIVKPMDHAQLAARVRKERDFWAPIAKQAGFQFE
ncbi:ABC transporter substrate-binding protein [Bordetella genomosp. 8]|uniref:ABC transporter substrate-binding protein n=1 Tax=Bordetella genomosp. 8 TaxID=1416806 RepID=A0A1W6YG86_9BORD|nr:tripartite tricarboxylate transporter substrate binding protein [Bordetella genomosp. 8]ARP80042.1 ABC transporter substrate-binding protein [Bordetella genomosp. 8]